MKSLKYLFSSNVQICAKILHKDLNISSCSISSQETEYPVVMLALFIEQQTPFIDEYFKNIEDFNYPKNKMHLYIHVNVSRID